MNLEAVAELEANSNPKSGCSENSKTGSCSRSEQAKSRKKRVVTLPNLTSLVVQNRIIVPQPPVGCKEEQTVMSVKRLSHACRTHFRKRIFHT